MSDICKSRRVPTTYSLQQFSEQEGIALKEKAMEISDKNDFSIPTGSFSVSELRHLSVSKVIYDDYAVEIKGGGRTKKVLTYRLTRQYRTKITGMVEVVSAVSTDQNSTVSSEPVTERPFCPPRLKRRPLKAMSDRIDVAAELRLPLFLCVTSTFREQTTVDLDRASITAHLLNSLAEAGYLKPPRGNKWSLADPYGRVARAFSGGRLKRAEIADWIGHEEDQMPQ